MSVLGELKRRKIVQVIAVYAVVAWLVVQVITSIEQPLNLPDWTDTLVIVLLVLGFPVMLVVSWAFNVTPGGLVRDEGGERSEKTSSRKIEFVLFGLVAVAVVWLIYRTEFDEQPPPESVVAENAATDLLPNSVAVLPFENMSPDPNNAYFAAGIHDTILNELAKVSDLNVVSRTAMLHYAEANTPLKQIAEELKVQTIMEGSVQYAAGRVLVTAQLIDPVTNLHLWSENYDREFADVFAIQADIATRIALAMQAELSDVERASIEKPLTNSPEAYSLYLRAMDLAEWNIGPDEFSRPEFHRLLDSAIALDPSFARAYAAKGFAFTFGESELSTAVNLANKARELDPDLGLSYATIGMVHGSYRRHEEARTAFETAYRLAPNDLEVIDDYARIALLTGDHAKALDLARRAVELDPGRSYLLGMVLWGMGDLRAARDAYRKAAEYAPRREDTRLMIAILEQQMGNTEAVEREVRIARQVRQTQNVQGTFIFYVAYRYRLLGYHDDADARLSDYYEKVADGTPVVINSPRWILLHLAAGDHEKALQQLRLIVERIENGLPVVGLPILVALTRYRDPLQETPEFVQIRNSYTAGTDSVE